MEELLASGQDATLRGQLLHHAAATGSLTELAALYEAAASRAQGTPQAAALLHGAAEASAVDGKGAEAEAFYRRIVGMQPDDGDAQRKLGAIYRHGERWAELAALVEGYVTCLPAGNVERSESLVDLAWLYEEKLGQPYEAITALE